MEQQQRLFDLNEISVGMEATDHQQQTISNDTIHTFLNLHSEEQDSQTPPTNEATDHQQPRTKRLTNEQRADILFWLLERATNGELQYGSVKAAAQVFRVSVRTISPIWNTAKRQRAASERYNVTNNFHKSGRKKITVPTDQIKTILMGGRTCIRDLASNLNMCKTTVHRMIKDRFIRAHSNSLHPTLTDANKVKRLEWILSLLPGDTPEAKKEYHHMYDFVHLDEKWFYLSKKTCRVYLAQNEKGMYRSGSSSKFIPKVMFTAAVARPRFNFQGECTFDGRIGIFPFTYKEAAKRGSKNRDKGTLVTKVVESVNRNVTRDMLINQIVPAIKSKWPKDAAPKVIFIQQDNAKAHINQSDEEWQEVYNEDGFTFILIQQPPNSPDLNILDLGFFRSIQSLMHKKMPKDVDKMLEAVNEAFYELHPKTLRNVWMSLQCVMNAILKVRGGNDYDLPHVNKKKLEAEGDLKGEIMAPMWSIMQAWENIHGEVQQTQANAEQTNTEHETDEGTTSATTQNRT